MASSFDPSLLSSALIFSAKDMEIAAGANHSLVVPMSAADGGFLKYEFEEKSGEGVTFSVTTVDAKQRILLEELQPQSDGSVHVPPRALGADGLKVQWSNTEAWLSAVTVGYTLRVVSMTAVKQRLDQRLLHAAEHGPPSVVSECLAGGASVKLVDEPTGHTPLLRAALANQPEAITLLIAAGASVADTDRHGNTPLHLCALAGGSADCAMALLEGNAPMDARNGEGATPLLLASFRREVKKGGGTSGAGGGGEEEEATDVGGVASALLSAGADPSLTDTRGNTACHLAASQNRPELLRALLSAGAGGSVRNNKGETPLSLSAAKGADACVEVLLKAAEGSKKDEGGDDGAAGGAASSTATAAASLTSDEAARALAKALAASSSSAAESRSRAVVRLLNAPSLSASAASAALSGSQQIALDRAFLISCKDGFELPALRLLDAGASLAAATEKGTNGSGSAAGMGPLTLAAACGNAPLVSLLMRADAKAQQAAAALGRPSRRPSTANLTSSDRRGALDAAASSGHTAACQALLVNDGITSPASRRALYVAASAGRTGLVLTLLQRGGDAPEQGTLLHAAAANGHTVLALALLRNGCCQLSATDESGRTAAHVAMEGGYDQCALAMLRAATDADALRFLARAA